MNFAAAIALAILTFSTFAHASSHAAKKAPAKMSAQEIDKMCKDEVQKGAQKEVDRQEAQAKAANNRSFSKSKALADVKKDIYEGCVKSHK